MISDHTLRSNVPQKSLIPDRKLEGGHPYDQVDSKMNFENLIILNLAEQRIWSDVGLSPNLAEGAGKFNEMAKDVWKLSCKSLHAFACTFAAMLILYWLALYIRRRHYTRFQ